MGADGASSENRAKVDRTGAAAATVDKAEELRTEQSQLVTNKSREAESSEYKQGTDDKAGTDGATPGLGKDGELGVEIESQTTGPRQEEKTAAAASERGSNQEDEYNEEVPYVARPAKSDRASSLATSAADGDVHPHHVGRPSLSGNHLSLGDVAPVEVQIRGLGVSVDTSPSVWEPSTYPDLWKQTIGRSKTGGSAVKTLLHSVSASFVPGTLTAIVGGSGSGKTTLLNTLAERMSSPRLSVEGTTVFRGGGAGGQGSIDDGDASCSVHSVRHAYVMQQDILLPTLTVRETLWYSAELRLPPSTTAAERMRVVEEVILELGLKECADTRIGDHAHKGCSGGEKRRVSIGVQMLGNPSVLFLDEPTTGLDSTSAFQLVRTLKTLARKGRTVITTIHQPRSEIWALFDGTVVLAKGSPVYSGPVDGCLPWFAGLGFELPPFVNPAEFVIDIAAVDNRTPEVEQESTARVQRLKAAWAEEAEMRFGPLSDATIAAAASSAARRFSVRKAAAGKHASFLRQTSVLTSRTFKVTIRDPMGMAASLIEAVLMGLATGYIFFELGRDQAGIRSRQGALYTAAGLQGYLFLLFEAYRLSIDIPSFDREHSEGCADVVPFLLSRRLARLLTEDVPVPFIFSTIFFFMAGFDRTAERFLTFFAVCLLNHYIAVTCAMTCIAAVRHFPGASLIANLSYTMQSIACGFFVQSNTIPVYVRWLKYLTYTYYVFGAFCGNEFQGSFFDCPFPGGPDSPACVSYTGDYVMRALGFPDNWVWRPIVVLVAFVVFFYGLAGIGLACFPVEMTIARARPSDTDLSFGKEKMNARSIAEVRAIDLGLDAFSLTLDKKSLAKGKTTTKTILEPVSTTFQAGKINVIMGPSGSGKTSLLNAMALRLRNSPGTRYRRSGKLTFNGAEPSEAVIRSVCSYVSQDDNALLPSLTVRETLRFAAGLRLSSWMSRAEKEARAEEVLLKMGLKDCADNLVGSDLIKGISGGEKRRVTIAVQVLTDPRVLLLDEPTSGLDAFTTLSLLELFAGLAGEGRTLILTIHQSRSDLFRHFGNVLLLARGGSPVYAGPSTQMLPYFGGLGFNCPRNTNPADYALDLITIDLQHEKREEESRKKVRVLVDAWQAQVERAEKERAAAAAGSSFVRGLLRSSSDKDTTALEPPPRVVMAREGAIKGGENVDDSKEEAQVRDVDKTPEDVEAQGGSVAHPVVIVDDAHPVQASGEHLTGGTAATAAGPGTETDKQDKMLHPSTAAEVTGALSSLERKSTASSSLIPPPRRSFNKATLATPAELGALVRKKAGFFTAFPILLRRALINFRRQPPLLVARSMQVLGLGIILALFFAPLKNDFYSVQNRVGFVQQMAAFYFVGMLQNVAVYPAERDVFYAEDDDGLYAVEPFLLSYTLLELPLELASCLVFGVLAVFAVGFERTAELYFVCVFVCFGIVNCGESLGIMFNTLFSNHTGFAINVTSVLLSVANIMAGILSIDMPELFHAFNYLSPVRYAVLALAPFTLRNVDFACEPDQRLPDGRCIIATGADVLDLYKLNVDGGLNLAYLGATTVVYRLVAWALLRAVRSRWK